MSKFAVFNDEGFPTAFYWQDDHTPGIPVGAIEITDEQWLELIDNAGLRRWNGERVVEYTPPEPTPEELRVQMPPLSRRQFGLGANSLGLSKADVLAATDDPIIIIEIKESGEFHRDYESIVMLAPLLGITPEQLDDVWMWWASA
ncbi:hypothetical protein [Brucella gallinifaecis]|uniref:hypothetical protein n=1 Tax=Brucella gallinifaecis TaxID=215590 RepID=UPI00235E74C0|nr:hypothetical protein [Brucella gallinifaecis]